MEMTPSQRAIDYWQKELCGYDPSGNFLSEVLSEADYSEFDLRMLRLLGAIQSPEMEEKVADLRAFVRQEPWAFIYKRKLALLSEYMDDWDDKDFWQDLCESLAGGSLANKSFVIAREL